MMKQAKMTAVGVLLLAVAAGAWAQGYAVVLHNAQDATFYYLVDPQALAGFDPASSVFPAVVQDFFAAQAAPGEEPVSFTELGPGETRRLEGLSEGAHLLLGFFAVAGQREFPAQVLSLQAGGGTGERAYTLSAEPALARVRAGQGRLAAYPPFAAAAAEAGRAGAAPAAGSFRFRIDNQYDDWEAIPPVVAYGGEHAPEWFTVERWGRALEVLPIGSARHWGVGGTALNELKIVADAEAVYMYAASQAAIDSNLSLFLYLHGGAPGAIEPNRLTLELVPSRGAEPGLVVLWQKDRQPALVGELASGNFFLEARLDRAALEPALLAAEPEVRYFDFTTAYFDRGDLSYEEFFYGSLEVARIPTIDTLYVPPRP